MSTSTNQFNFTADANNNSDGSGEKNSGSSAVAVKRKRLTQACDACRKKKVKCSGEKPSCNNCARLNVPCTYLPSTRKRGPRVGLVESLEKRLQQMEKLLQPLKEQGLVDDSDDQSLSPSTKKPRLNPISTAGVDPDDQLYSDQNSSASSTSSIPHQEFTVKTQFSPSSAQFNKPTPGGHNEQPEFIDSFSQPLQPLPSQLKNTNEASTIDGAKDDCVIPPFLSQHFKLEETSEDQFFGNTSPHPGFKKTARPIFLNNNYQLQNRMINGLPTEDIVEHLALCFFRHIDGQLSMFHEHTFMRQLRQHKISPFLILAMCAVSSRYSEHPNIKREPSYLAGEPYAFQASQHVLDSLDSPCVEAVQAFILLALYCYGTAQGAKTYMYIGIAIRMAHSLGLHKLDDITPNSSSDDKGSEDVFIAKETKRRTFWSCFMFDRFSSCALGRPLIIQEEDCDVRLPCIESVWAMESPYNSPAIDEQLNNHYTKQKASFMLAKNGIIACFHSVNTLLGRVSTYVNRSRPTNAIPPWDLASEFSKLENDIEEWYQSILPHYNYSREKMIDLIAVRNGGAFASLHLLYYTAIVILNRSNFIKLRKGEPMSAYEVEFMRSSSERCYNAAKQVTSIASDLLEVGCQFMCPFTLYPLFVTATIYINDLNNEDITIASFAKENLKVHEQFFNEMEPLWGIAGKMKCVMKCMKKQNNSETHFSENKRPSQDETERSDAGLMDYWDKAPDANNGSMIHNTSMNSFNDPFIPTRLLYNMEQPLMNDSWMNFLRSPSPVSPISPGFLRRFARHTENGENTNEEGYFSQDMTLYSNNNPYTYDYSMIADIANGQPFSEWSTGRLMSNRRNLNDISELGSIIQNSLTPSQVISSNFNVSNLNVLGGNSQLLNPIASTAGGLGVSNIEQTSNKGFTASAPRAGDVQIDAMLRSN
ncbi:fungal-specific transcription factor domain-containing protein [Gigaspora margarita]|uniref:Fungal-specific transcription factor domain-containing protein n=1 Tax=Gigaspora margarita TaxID=4874 RepID=A0A8H4A2U2_GIGMA|nr:fungal-specific transcription factor domain-containing protein [Gigaspora margarita]